MESQCQQGLLCIRPSPAHYCATADSLRKQRGEKQGVRAAWRRPSRFPRRHSRGISHSHGPAAAAHAARSLRGGRAGGRRRRPAAATAPTPAGVGTQIQAPPVRGVGQAVRAVFGAVLLVEPHCTAPAQSGFRGLDLRLGQLNAHKMFYASRGCFMRVEIK